MGNADVYRFWVIGFVMMWSLSALAMPPKRITPQEKALLPTYCRYTQGGYVGHEQANQPSPEAKRWVQVFGGEGMTANLWRMHHYCYALIHMMRGYRGGLSKMEFKEAWGGAIEEIDYTLQFLSDNFVLMPEILLNRGRALVRLKRDEAAMESFRKSVQIKPDYWPPYLDMAEIFLNENNKDKAIEILREGLKHAPESVALSKRLSELGGKLPIERLDSKPTKVPTISQEQPVSNHAEKRVSEND